MKESKGKNEGVQRTGRRRGRTHPFHGRVTINPDQRDSEGEAKHGASVPLQLVAKDNYMALGGEKHSRVHLLHKLASDYSKNMYILSPGHTTQKLLCHGCAAAAPK